MGCSTSDLGSIASVPRTADFRSAPVNGHHQIGSVGPFRAITGNPRIPVQVAGQHRYTFSFRIPQWGAGPVSEAGVERRLAAILAADVVG